MTKRKTIPGKIQAEVLIACRRRCALCFGLDRDHSEQKGQIAHLDRNAENNAIENLVFLCLPHHDQYDSRPSQSKGITKEELRRYGDDLLQNLHDNQLRNTAEEEASLVLTIDEVAAFLRVDESEVGKLVSTGDLASVRLGSELRILDAALIDFLRRNMRQQQLDSLRRTLEDPNNWRESLAESPHFARQILEGEFPEDSFGRFLQRALMAE